MTAALIAALIVPAGVAASGTAPTAVADDVATLANTPVTGNLLANDTDPEADTLTITSAHLVNVAYGTLSVAANGDFTYTPAAGWSGSVTHGGYYWMNDGTSGSVKGWINLVVNFLPVATAQSVSTDEDTAAPITLAGTDCDGTIASYAIVAAPAHGGLTGTGANRTYTPNANWHGVDTFTFTVTDNIGGVSPAATVTVTVASVEDVPVATAQGRTVVEDTATAITLAGTDGDGDPLTYHVATNPAHGALTGTAPNLTYTPAANYHGADSFTFTVNDSKADSAPATVSITVTSVNDAPVATAQGRTVVEDTATAITLAGTDVEGDPLTYHVATNPAHGALTGTTRNLTYTPSANYHGADSFTFTVNDGHGNSAPATVTITVTSVDDAPVANSQSVDVDYETAKTITLTGSDVENDTVSFAVVIPPSHGSLTGTGANRTYTPDHGYRGTDAFTFKTIANGLESALRVVTITVADADAPIVAVPTVAFGRGTVNESAPIAITWSANDGTGSGVATYTVEAKVGSGAWTQISTGTARTTTKYYPFNTDLRWRVKATDIAGNVSGWTESATRRISAYQGGSPVATTGRWSSVTSSRSSGTGYLYTTTAGKYKNLTFTGIGVLYVATKTSSAGYVKLKIDWSTTRLNLRKSGTASLGVIMGSRSWATSGTHSIRVTNNQAGRRATLDAFIVLR